MRYREPKVARPRRRPRTLQQVPPRYLRKLRWCLLDYWRKAALPTCRHLRQPPDPWTINQADLYAALRLAGCRATARYRSHLDPQPLDRVLQKAFRVAFIVEVRRQRWWESETDRERWEAILTEGGWPTEDLLFPRAHHEVVDDTPDTLTHLVDDLPDRDALPLDQQVFARIRSAQVHVLLRRLPRRFRGPVWRVFALDEDAFTAGRALGMPLRECHPLAQEGLARLQRLVKRRPELLLPFD